MANPTVIECPVDVWTLVATNVQTGSVKVLKTDTGYSQTYRVTGDPAPADDTDAYDFKDILTINDSNGIDVYIKALNIDGRVRVDV